MYEYEKEKHQIFTEDGQRMFLAIRDHAHRLIAEAGAARLDKIINGAGGGDSWGMLACVDRLVALGELHEVTESGTVSAQNRVFVSTRQR